jgi:hypothetical protein
MSNFPAFDRYIGIDYSGAQTPDISLKELRVFVADSAALPTEVPPPVSPRKFWTRRANAEWLLARLLKPRPTIVGIHHGFSFPMHYFLHHRLPMNWEAFLVDFQQHWLTDNDYTYVDFVIDGVHGNGAARSGHPRWRRSTELRAGPRAKSQFSFGGPGSIAKSTHAGLPWLLFLRGRAQGRIHFWPFDGWEIPKGKSCLAEVRPWLWSSNFRQQGRDKDQHDAYSIAARLQLADQTGDLEDFLKPSLSHLEEQLAAVEGWILGVKELRIKAQHITASNSR